MFSFLSLLFCAQSDKRQESDWDVALELPSREMLLVPPFWSHCVRGRIRLKGGNEKDLGCPGSPQPAGAGTERGAPRGGRAGGRQERVRGRREGRELR